MPTMRTASINGPDNVGKTTQMNLMPKHEKIQIFSSIHNYDNYLRTLFENQDEFQDWWFNKSSHEDHILTIMNAVKNRADISLKESKVRISIFDRGGVMFEAVCISTIASKENCELDEAKKVYNSILNKHNITVYREDIRILLKHCNDVEESVKKTLSRQSSCDAKYESYQNLLQKQLTLQQLENNFYTHIVVVGDKSAIEVQNEIRLIYSSCSPEVLPFLKLMFSNLKFVIAFGGMSECGKSTLTEQTCGKFELAGMKCLRLKIAYLMELAAQSLQCNVYELSPDIQACELLKQLDHFLNRHYWINAVTIESLHCFSSTQSLKNFLGNMITIVYVDASEDVRMKRSNDPINVLHEKDIQKISRGADKIKRIADYILDNNKCSLEWAADNICEHIHGFMLKKFPSYQPLFSHEFVFSAGAVLICKSTHKVCLIHRLDGKKEWMLPKGRKNVGETIQKAAIRETFEETGYTCFLMPLAMKTRAPPAEECGHTPDVPREIMNNSEPFALSIRPIKEDLHNQKLVFWYVAQVDEQIPQKMNMQIGNENFKEKFVPFAEAIQLLTYDDDRQVLNQAVDLFQNTYGSQGSMTKC